MEPLAKQSNSAEPFGLARGLGWFSLALGLTQLLAPRVLTRPMGLQGKETFTRACGARELVSGVGLLASKKPAPWLWLRSGGDALDLATLALHARHTKRRRGLVVLAFAAVAGVTALDLMGAKRLQGKRGPIRPATHDYSNRSGLPQSPDAMRGVARQGGADRASTAPAAGRARPDPGATPAPDLRAH